MPREATVAYRAFWSEKDHLVPLSPGRFRIASALFKTREGLSVGDGELCDPADVARWVMEQRAADGKPPTPCGVVAVSKVLLSTLGVELALDDADTPGEVAAGHRVLLGTSRGKNGKILAERCWIVIALPGYDVVTAAASDASTRA
jgi:hypothetical protein